MKYICKYIYHVTEEQDTILSCDISEKSNVLYKMGYFSFNNLKKFSKVLG